MKKQSKRLEAPLLTVLLTEIVHWLYFCLVCIILACLAIALGIRNGFLGQLVVGALLAMLTGIGLKLRDLLARAIQLI